MNCAENERVAETLSIRTSKNAEPQTLEITFWSEDQAAVVFRTDKDSRGERTVPGLVLNGVNYGHIRADLKYEQRHELVGPRRKPGDISREPREAADVTRWRVEHLTMWREDTITDGSYAARSKMRELIEYAVAALVTERPALLKQARRHKLRQEVERLRRDICKLGEEIAAKEVRITDLFDQLKGVRGS